MVVESPHCKPLFKTSLTTKIPVSVNTWVGLCWLEKLSGPLAGSPNSQSKVGTGLLGALLVKVTLYPEQVVNTGSRFAVGI